VALACVGATGCQPLTQIILIIDSNLSSDRLDVKVTVTGPTASPVLLDYNFANPATPPFAWTLGLSPRGSTLGPISVMVAATDNADVVEQVAQTEFVSGESRTLRMLLLTSCMGVVCPDAQTCGANGCGPIEQVGTSLPTWNGMVPPSPSTDPTVPISGRTVWAGGWHSCANDGSSLYCWGQNKFGELGIGTTLNASSRERVPLVASASMPLRAVGLGNIDSCVCDATGQAFCWGTDTAGELGNPTMMGSQVPLAVDGLTDCVQISGGAAHMCAVHDTGQVSCWGDNTFGQIGGGAALAKMASVSTPTLVRDAQNNPFGNVAEVFGGDGHTCARRTDKTVWCWGDNADHQLGDGTAVAMRAVPSQVVGITTAEEIASGRFSTCARLTSGHVMCWGQNTSGQLGDGDVKVVRTPVEVAGITDAIQITAGKHHACALHGTAPNLLACWGGNELGQIGIGSTTTAPVLVPTEVLEIVGATSIAAGSVHTCARHSKGLSCWGENIVNELGDNTDTNRSQQVLVSGFP